MITGFPSPGIDAGTLQRLIALTKAVTVPTYSIAAPQPIARDRGTHCIIRDANGVDTLYVCLLTSAGVYTWWPVVQSS